jgi:serine/threonine protein phosphatase PrpC
MGSAFSSPITTQHVFRFNSDFFRAACIHVQGFRNTQEDDDSMFTNPHGISCFAVYDGHGGPEAARYLHENATNSFANLSTLADHDLITQIIMQLDQDFLATGYEDGATACIVFLQPWDLINDVALPKEKYAPMTFEKKNEIGLKLLAVNIGDSRAMIIQRDGTFMACTEDHKPQDPVEHHRIVTAGGFVQNNRVDGNLALSRAIGDSGYKNNPSLPADKQKVICVPDYEEFMMQYGDVLLVACDGIYEGQVMDYAKVGGIIHDCVSTLKNDILKKNELISADCVDSLYDPAIVSRKIIEQSLCFNSRDNHTAITISFSSLNYKNSDQQSEQEKVLLSQLKGLSTVEIIPGPRALVRQDDDAWAKAYLTDLHHDAPHVHPESRSHIEQIDTAVLAYQNSDEEPDAVMGQTLYAIPLDTIDGLYSIPPIAVQTLAPDDQDQGYGQQSFLQQLFEMTSQMNNGNPYYEEEEE